ncbi:hypothetical protein llap_6211 [Limosa lapponica baueri]|uniref:Uncharacterized protein n=1 Tax=Limosa lapponica baueri TaxID=1758121 RepID=A0A2I0UBQ7_LIMLA|nr:hypothetical protein llap_6211 [Limosa lapponica baueri]
MWQGLMALEADMGSWVVGRVRGGPRGGQAGTVRLISALSLDRRNSKLRAKRGHSTDSDLAIGHSPAASQQDWVCDIDNPSKARNQIRSRVQTGRARDTWRQDYNVCLRSIKETELEKRPETMILST